jgi:hypothetical protein
MSMTQRLDNVDEAARAAASITRGFLRRSRHRKGPILRRQTRGFMEASASHSNTQPQELRPSSTITSSPVQDPESLTRIGPLAVLV